MESQECLLCEGHKWVYITSEPIPPYHDLFGSDCSEESCTLCNSDGSIPLPDSIDDWDSFTSWRAYALGGLEGKYTVLQSGDRTIVAQRSVWDFWWHMQDYQLRDCPVCYGWGIWSDNGQIQDCIACGGQPIEARKGYNPLHAYGPFAQLNGQWIYVQRKMYV